MTGNLQLLKKISAKTVLGGKVERPSEAKHLFRVIGVVTGMASGQSNFGEWLAFKGEFQVIRADGARFYGVKLFLPDPAESLLAAAFKGLQGEKAGMVEIALDIGIKPSDVPIGYEYTAAPLVEIKSSDPVAALMARIGQGPAALPAPSPVGETEAAPKKSKKRRSK